MHYRRNETKPAILSIDAALYHAAHDYAGGVPALAAMLHQNARTLQNKLNIGEPETHPTLRDFRDILNITRDARILEAVCAPIDYVAVRVGPFDTAGDSALLAAVSAGVERLGDLTRQLAAALDNDNAIDDAELAALDARTHAVHRAIAQLQAQIHARHDARVGRVVPAKFARGG